MDLALATTIAPNKTIVITGMAESKAAKIMFKNSKVKAS